MPYAIHPGPCKSCSKEHVLFREKWHAANKRFYVQAKCRECELAGTKAHQQANPEYWRALNNKAYLKKVGGALTNVLNRSAEDRRVRALQKVKNRQARVARAAFSDELTQLVAKEAKRLASLRTLLTGVKWSVDHVVPFAATGVCGLHIWSNIQVIPLIENCKKGNRYALHTA